MYESTKKISLLLQLHFPKKNGGFTFVMTLVVMDGPQICINNFQFLLAFLHRQMLFMGNRHHQFFPEFIVPLSSQLYYFKDVLNKFFV
jgi:hypothetical protein